MTNPVHKEHAQNSPETPYRFKRTLTLGPLVFMGLAYMAPMAVFSPYGVVADLTQGRVAASYLLALVMILFTAYSYGKMVKAFPSSGSAYTYTQKTMNTHLGFVVGWAVLMDYLFLPMLNSLANGVFLHAMFPAVPAWIWILVSIAVITSINVLGIKLNARVNSWLVLFQVLAVVLFVAQAIQWVLGGNGTGTLLTAQPFYSPDLSFSLVLAGASIVCTSFLGFDAVTTFTEETVDAKKTVPRAILIVALTGGVLFVSLSYLMHVVYPTFSTFSNLETAGYEVVQALGSALLTSLFTAAFIASGIAASLSSHASASRLLYVMGRESMLPARIFGYLHPRWKTPVYNVLIVAVVCLSAYLIDYATAFSFINFGAILAFTFVNLSVIVHYYIRQKMRDTKGFLLYFLIPFIGICFNIWIWTNLDRNALIMGGIWILLGIVYLCVITRFFTRQPPQLRFEEIDQDDVSASS